MTADKPESGSDDDETQFLMRLRYLLSDFSQSEISRRTGISVANVSRYMRGTTIPASFCRLLIVKLGVNPAWLMVGQGSPFLDDINTEVAGVASKMLNVVTALNTVTKKRLGELTGKRHAHVLRGLDEALKRFEALQNEMNAWSQPVLAPLIEDIESALLRGESERAAGLRKVAEQVARLNNSDDLQNRLDHIRSYHEGMIGNKEESLKYQRRIFHKLVEKGVLDNKDALSSVQKYVSALFDNRYIDEARRVAHACLSLSQDGLSDDKTTAEHRITDVHRSMLTESAANFDVELGDIGRGLSTLQSIFPTFSEDYRKNTAFAHLSLAQLLSGTTTIEQVLIVVNWESPAWVTNLAKYATWLEDVNYIGAVSEKCTGKEDQGSLLDVDQAAHVTILNQILKNSKKASLDKYEEEISDRVPENKQSVTWKVEQGIRITQVARLLGKKEAASKKLHEVIEQIAEMPREKSLCILDRATHCRNILDLITTKTRDSKLKQARSQAETFVKEYIDKGYGFLRSLQS